MSLTQDISSMDEVNNYQIKDSQRSDNKPKGKVKKRNLQARAYKDKLKVYNMQDSIIAKEVLSADLHSYR